MDAALDARLRHRLQDVFGTVAAEPAPDDLLRLIGKHRAGRQVAWDGPAYRRRGARIDGRLYRLVLRGNPLDGFPLGPAGAVAALIDLWLDEAGLPDAARVAQAEPR